MTLRQQLIGSAIALTGMAGGLLIWAYLPKYLVPVYCALAYLVIVAMLKLNPARDSLPNADRPQEKRSEH